MRAAPQWFLLFPLAVWLGIFAVPPAGATEKVTTPGGVEIISETPGPDFDAVVRQVKELDRQISRYFRNGRSKNVRPCRIVVDPDLIALRQWRSTPEMNILAVSSDLEQWQNSPEVHQALTALLSLSRLGVAVQEENAGKYPGWITDGLLQRVTESQRETLVRIAYYPALRALILGDCLPDFRRECAASPAARAAGGPLYRAHREVCAFMLETFFRNGSATDNLLHDYLVLLIQEHPEEEAFAATLGRVLLQKPSAVYYQLNTPGADTATIIQAVLAAECDARVFNAYDPMPAAETAERLLELRQISYIRADNSNVSADLCDLPQLYDRDPEARVLIKSVLEKISRLGNYTDATIKMQLSQLAATVGNINKAPAAALRQEILRQFANLDKQLKQQEKIEQYLDAMESEFVPPGKYFQYELEAGRSGGNALSWKMNDYIDQVEKTYLEE